MTILEPGHVAVVTGGASGIGFALTAAFLTRGLGVVIADLRADALDGARDRLAAADADVLAVPTDVSDEDAVNALAAATIDHFGTVDIVCNNAGVANYFTNCWEIERSEWEHVMSVNVWGTINGVRAFVPHLVRKGSGHVLNTASMAGLVPFPRFADYVMSKYAVVALTEVLRADLDLAAPGVGATVLCPASTDTPLGRLRHNTREDAGADAAITATTQPPRIDSLPPESVAECAIAAIEANRLYAAPSFFDPRTSIDARFSRLVGEIAEGPAPWH